MPSPVLSQLPSATPTADPWPTIILPIVADTYIQGGDSADLSFGTQDVYTTQLGTTDADTAYSLLQFDLTDFPADTTLRERQIMLRLVHVTDQAAAGTTSIALLGFAGIAYVTGRVDFSDYQSPWIISRDWVHVQGSIS